MGAITTAVSAVSAIGSLVGTGMEAASQVSASQAQANAYESQGKQQKQLADAQAELTRAEGLAAKQVADFEAAQLKQRAGAERVTSQFQSIEEQRRARLAASKARAIAAASGGGTGGSVKTILGRLAAEGDWNAAVALYEGEEAARGLESQARLTEMQGKFAKDSSEYTAALQRAGGQYASQAGNYAAKNLRRSGYMSAAGSLISGGSSFYSKYWPTDDEAATTAATPRFVGGIGGTGSHYQYG